MNEIGSEFWDVPTIDRNNDLFRESIQWYISGRSALKAIIKELKDYKTVAMPSWCCGSMIKPFIDAGLDIYFYPVYFDGGLVQQIRMDCDVLFVIDYFGYTSKHPELTNFNGVVIRDMTHSIFSSTYFDADYYFGSLRKWCGVWTGGYAWAKNGHKLLMGDPDTGNFTSFREKAMNMKKAYMRGNGDKKYLRVFDEAEECLETVFISPATDRDIWLAKRLDIVEMRKRRRANAEVLKNAFFDWLIFSELNDTDCPMFVPVLVPDGKRDVLRRYLIQNEIYCPIHWPVSEYHKLCEMTADIYKNELSLVCDQRYTKDDMYRVTKTINSFWKE